jgi:enterochelin esterase family protein
MKKLNLKKSLLFLALIGICFNLYAQRNPKGLKSPEVQPDNSVIFRVKVPGATSVSVVGSWPTEFKNRIEMTKKDSGVFEAKVGPLPSDMYEYEFMVDSVSFLDPGNIAVTRDGSWIMNQLMVPGKTADQYDVKPVPHGNVTAVWYPSPVIGSDRRMMIYTPPGYSESKKSYPVLYLLHGAGADEEAWVSRGRANYIIDNLIAAGKAVPMIVVITNGNPSTPGAPLERSIELKQHNPATGPGAMVSGKFEESLIKDIIPYVEKNYRVIADPAHRAITGFSMGGYHTEMITNANPGKFDYIGVMSMGLFTGFGRPYDKDAHVKQLDALKKSNPKVYWIGIGKEDFLYPTVVKLRGLYDEVGLKYIYRESAGRHDWNSWRPYLNEFAALLFK